MIFTYGCYHNNPINKIIHVIGIPLISFCIAVCLMYFYQLPKVNEFFEKSPLPSEPIYLVALFPYLPMTIVYLIADVVVGLVWCSYSIPAGVLINYLVTNYKDTDHFGMSQFNFFLVLQVACWISQFIGHRVFEKRAPALLTNMLYIFLAPFFETFLVMNKLFGYREGPQMRKLQKLIDEDVEDFRAQKMNKKSDNFKRA